MATTTEKLQDPNLSEREQDEIIGAFVRQQEDARLRERWETKLQQEYKLTKKPPAPNRSGASIRRIGTILAAVAASLLLLFVLLPQFLQPDGPELLATYMEEVTIDGVRDVAETPANELRRQFTEAYRSQRFAEAVTVGQTLVNLPEATDEDNLNLGEAYLRNQQFDQANGLFDALINTKSTYTTEARFNLALGLLSQQKIDTGLAELSKIADADGNRIYQKAQELLEADWQK